MPLYFAWIENHTDRRDDEVLKIRVSTKKAARAYAEEYCLGRGGASVLHVMTRRQFRRYDPWWHALLWGKAPDNEMTKRKR